MKKVFSVIFAGLLALAAVSCVNENLAVFDASKATAPVLGSYDVGEKNISANYTPAVISMGFNEKIAPKHSFAIVNYNGTAVSKTVPSTDKDGVLSLSTASLTRTLMGMGATEGSTVSLEMVVRASLQTPAQDNGVNGFVDSEGRITINDFVITVPTGSPYAEYTEATTWSVIGALSEYGIEWNGDLEMWATSDGTKMVAKCVNLKKDDQFKFRKDQAWDVNYGATGDTEPFVVTLDSAFEGAQGGKNLAVPADGFYDLWLDLSGAAAAITVTEAYRPYPGHTDASTWSVIGNLSEYGIEWNGDLAMTTDGTTHVAQGIKLKAADQFKFRKDGAWDVNFGATGDVEPFVVSLGSETDAAQGGKNLAVPADGVYDLVLNPDGQTFTIVETLGGGVSGKIGGEPGPDEPETYTGWGLIGVGGDWEHDVAMTEADGVWTAYATIAAADGWKLRKDAAWDENRGAEGDEEPYVLTIDTPVHAINNGKNLAVPADGFYKVTFNSATDEITISAADVWAVIGQFNGWSGDAFMTLVDGKWVSPEIDLVAGEGWKLRYNAGWDVNRGAVGETEPFTVTAGEPVEVVHNGKNLAVEADGKYVITYDPSAETITVEPAIPADRWSVIGQVNGTGWDTDFYMTETDGVWVSDVLTIKAGDGFKVRFNNDWGVNRGATGDVEPYAIGFGDAVAAVQNGKNLTVKEDGDYRLVYDANREILYLFGWTVIGQVNGTGWDTDILMHPVSEGVWESEVFTVEGGFKIRFNMDWGVNRGAEGDVEPYVMTSCIPVLGTQNGKNLGVNTEAGLYWKLVYDANNEHLTVENCSWSVIGQVNGANWDKDVVMTETSVGKFVSDPFTIEGGFKLRFNRDWAVNRGAEGDVEPYMMSLETAINGVQNGKNLGFESPSGTYVISYNSVTESISLSDK